MFTGIRRTVTTAAVVTIGLAGTVAFVVPAQAGTTGYAEVRAAHFSPTTPGVDVYLSSFSGGSSTQWLSGVRYGAVSPYRRLAAGLYTIAMRPHGAPMSSKAMLSWTLDAKSGGAYTVAGVGAGSSVRGVVITDDLRTPPNGTGRVRVIQASSRAPIVTVRAESGPVIASHARFATTTGYADVHAGTWKLQVQSDGSSPALTATGSVDVASGEVTSVLLLDGKSAGIIVRTLVDAAGPASTPKGPVAAGAGGLAVGAGITSGLTTEESALGLFGTAALMFLAAGGILRRRPVRRLGAHAVG